MINLPLEKKEVSALKEYCLNFDSLHDCKFCQFETGEILISQGELVDRLIVILEGKVKVCMLAANGKNLNLCYYVAQGLLGDIEFVQDDKTATATSIAMFPTKCVIIPVRFNQKYLHNNIIFINRVAKGLALKLISSSEARITSALYSGEERLCAYILMAEHKGMFSEILADVAKSIGVSYRQLFRIINSMCKKGVLKKQDYGFLIIDRKYLKKKCADM